MRARGARPIGQSGRRAARRALGGWAGFVLPNGTATTSLVQGLGLESGGGRRRSVGAGCAWKAVQVAWPLERRRLWCIGRAPRIGRRGHRGNGLKSSLRSPVNYAVLGLVIEKPSYGYELMQRLQTRYGELLEVSSPSHVYTALDRLQKERLIVHHDRDPGPEPADEDAPTRQPKVTYRATADGAVVYRQWLAEQLRDDGARVELIGRLIATGARDLRAIGDLIDRYETECVAASQQLPLADRTAADAGVEHERDFVRRLVREERRFVLEAQLRWIDLAREELRARAARQSGDTTS